MGENGSAESTKDYHVDGKSLAQQLEQAVRNGDVTSCGEMVTALRMHTEALAGALKV
jgi:hypothetical protein